MFNLIAAGPPSMIAPAQGPIPIMSHGPLAATSMNLLRQVGKDAFLTAPIGHAKQQVRQAPQRTTLDEI
jgi:hypothetical protein